MRNKCVRNKNFFYECKGNMMDDAIDKGTAQSQLLIILCISLQED